MRQTWRRFGPADPVSIDDMMQARVQGVVTAPGDVEAVLSHGIPSHGRLSDDGPVSRTPLRKTHAVKTAVPIAPVPITSTPDTRTHGAPA